MSTKKSIAYLDQKLVQDDIGRKKLGRCRPKNIIKHWPKYSLDWCQQKISLGQGKLKTTSIDVFWSCYYLRKYCDFFKIYYFYTTKKN